MTISERVQQIITTRRSNPVKIVPSNPADSDIHPNAPPGTYAFMAVQGGPTIHPMANGRDFVAHSPVGGYTVKISKDDLPWSNG